MINVLLCFAYLFVAFITTIVFAILRNAYVWGDRYPNPMYEFLLGKDGPPGLVFGILWPVLLPIFLLSLTANKIEDFGKLVLAYEPVWAIGTGKTASADQAQEIHAHIRQTIAAKYGQIVADDCSILYGGSCNGANAKELFANPDVDGGLIGGASLAVDKFMPIIEAF